MKRLILCYLGGVLIGWLGSMCVVMPLVFFTSIDPAVINLIAFLLGMVGGASGGLFTAYRWGDA